MVRLYRHRGRRESHNQLIVGNRLEYLSKEDLQALKHLKGINKQDIISQKEANLLTNNGEPVPVLQNSVERVYHNKGTLPLNSDGKPVLFDCDASMGHSGCPGRSTGAATKDFVTRYKFPPRYYTENRGVHKTVLSSRTDRLKPFVCDSC